MYKTSTILLCGFFLQLVTLSTPALAIPGNSLDSEHLQLTDKITITGSVTSTQTRLPLAGVTVSLKGSSETTITDSNGNFSLEITDPTKSTIVFSHENHEQLAVKVGNQSVITVSLSEEKLVTTALGIKRKAESLSYSLTEIKGDELTNVAQENFVNSLAGRVAGLSISQTSGIGSSVNVVLRGFKSLSNDNQPLYVVDGVLMVSPLNNVARRGVNVDYGSPISDINPEDIESITVLKGLNAAALYGYRGGNGAILITTKSGQKGKAVRVHFSTSNTFETPYRFLDYNYRLANGSNANSFDEKTKYWIGPALDQGIKAVQWDSPLDQNGSPIPTELKSYKNNVKNFLQSAVTTINNLSVSGASNNFSYRAGFNLMKNQGLIPGSDLYRNGLTTSFQYHLLKTLKISTNLNYVNAGSGSAPSYSPLENPIEAAYDYSHVDIRKLQDYWLPGQEQIQQRSVNAITDNPYFLAKGINNSYNRNHSYGNLRIDWQILRTLNIYARVTRDKYSEKRETKIPMSYTGYRQGGYYLDNLGNKETNIDFLISYKNNINHFTFAVSAGGNFLSKEGHNSNIGGHELLEAGIYTVTNLSRAATSYSNSYYTGKARSAFGLATLSFKQQLYLDLTARKDWTLTSLSSNIIQLNPSAGLSWLINRSFDLPDAISLLKLKTSWAKVGTGRQFYESVPTGTNMYTSKLTNEVSTSQEYSIDAYFFENKLQFEATYFNISTKSPATIPAPYESNVSSTEVPGKFSSRGLELSMHMTPIYNKDGWSVHTTINWAKSRTRLDNLSGATGIYLWQVNGGGSHTAVGGNIGDLYSATYAKVNDPQSPYYRWPVLNPSGEWMSISSSLEREKVGNFNPKFLVGGQVSVSYKQFSLAASLDWRNGGQFISYTYRMAGIRAKSDKHLNAFPGGNYSAEELAQILKSNPEKYIIPGHGNFPVVGGYNQETGGFLTQSGLYDGIFIPGVQLNADGSYRENLGGSGTSLLPISLVYPRNFDSQVTFDADFIKLRELALSYSVKKFSWFEAIQFSIYSRNIMLWTKAKIGIDPERAFQNINGQFRQGIEYQNINPWTIPVGFKVSVTI